MKNSNLSALDLYMNRVFKSVILGVPIVTLVAGLTFSAIKLLGYYKEVPLGMLLAFDGSCVLYFFIGLIFFFLCNDSNGNLKPNVVKKGKLFIAVLELIQWNFITYMIPSRDFWAYAVFFVMVTVFFLDQKYYLLIACEIFVSEILSWILIPEKLLPVRDEYFLPELILRVVFLALAMSAFWLLTRSIQKRLVNVLEQMADFDTLTLLKNRRTLDATLENAIASARKGEGPFAVLMCDLDFFKRVNDEYGHECGDEVLKSVASILARIIGRTGTVFRYGGEEFFAVFRMNREEALALAEKAREEIASTPICYGDVTLHITITIGLTVYEGQSAERLIQCADANLYYGKNHGKNQVVI